MERRTMRTNAIRAASIVAALCVAADHVPAQTGAPGDDAGANARALVGDAARGEALYARFRCYACHGHGGETGPGPRLIPSRFDQAGFIAYVRNPATVYRGNAGGAMPPYAADGVSDQDLADIFAWLAASSPASPPLEEIPLLAD